MYTRWSLDKLKLTSQFGWIIFIQVLKKSGPKYEKHNNLIDGVNEVGDTNQFFNDFRVSKEKQ